MKYAACAFVVTVIGMLALAAAQEPTPAPAFEVAAIAEALSGQVSADLRSGALRPGVLVTETRLSITCLSLRDIVRRAYEVEHYQMSAPEWPRPGAAARAAPDGHRGGARAGARAELIRPRNLTASGILSRL